MTLLDCIRRVPNVIEDIVMKRKELCNPLLNYLEGRLDTIDEIVLCGSGTSNTCSETSHEFVEKASGLRTIVVLPNELLAKSVYNPNALYIFTSQSGTSTLTQAAQKAMYERGYLTCSITEDEKSPLASQSGSHVLLRADNEEFGQRTIGYCASILTQMIIAMEIGLKRNSLSQEEYNSYIESALKVPDNHKIICDKTLTWFDKNKWKLMNKDGFVLYGAGPLWGVAKEGALKILEIAVRYLCVGYEMDDGMHGPTMGFTNRHAIIILNDGRNNNIASGLARFIKAEVGDAFVIGANTIDDRDLAFETVGGPFACLEYAPVVEILAYRLAADYGIITKPFAEMEPLAEMKYFNTHDE